MPPPCCHIPTTGSPFFPILIKDAEIFSRYVAGDWPIPTFYGPPDLTSALHVELRLWQPPSKLSTKKYHANQAAYNAWGAMAQQVRNTFGPAIRNDFEKRFPISLPIAKAGQCCLAIYDKWLLDTLMSIRSTARSLPGAVGVLNGKTKPTALASLGLAQKIINIFIKYKLCWAVSGQYSLTAPSGFAKPADPLKVTSFTCALHAPIDSPFLELFIETPLGHRLVKDGYIFPREKSPMFRQTRDGIYRSWMKLDCLRTYYGFQLILRRLAMRAWPPSCACKYAKSLLTLKEECANSFDEWFPNDLEKQAPDWLNVALEIPDEYFDKTLAQIGR